MWISAVVWEGSQTTGLATDRSFARHSSINFKPTCLLTRSNIGSCFYVPGADSQKLSRPTDELSVREDSPVHGTYSVYGRTDHRREFVDLGRKSVDLGDSLLDLGDSLLMVTAETIRFG